MWLILLKSPRYCFRCSHAERGEHILSSPKQMFKQIWSHHKQSIILIENERRKKKRTHTIMREELPNRWTLLLTWIKRFDACFEFIDWYSFSVRLFVVVAVVGDTAFNWWRWNKMVKVTVDVRRGCLIIILFLSLMLLFSLFVSHSDVH